MWEVWKRGSTTISAFIILLPAQKCREDQKNWFVKDSNTSPSQSLVRFVPIPLNPLPPPSSLPPCSGPNINNYTFLFQLRHCPTIVGARVGEPESPVIELGPPLIFPWAGSQSQFVFTAPRQGVAPMGNNKECTRHEALESSSTGMNNHMTAVHSAIEAALSLVIILDNQKFAEREDVWIMLFPAGLWSLNFREGNWMSLLFIRTTDNSLGEQSVFPVNTV